MLEVRCEEKGGPVWRSVRPMDLSIQNILSVVEKLEGVTNFLPATNAYSIFLDERNTFFEVDQIGLIAVFPYSERVLHTHITFWDKRLRGREELCRDVARVIVGLTKKILITAIPEENAVILAFAKRLGFEEGSRNNGVVILHFTNYRE